MKTFTHLIIVVPFATVVLLVFGATFTRGQEVGPEVYQALTRQPTVRVIIALRPPAAPPRDLASRRAAIAALQQKVLSQLSAEEFTLTHQWAAISALAGKVSMGGLAKLRAHPDVVRVDLDEGGSGHLAQTIDQYGPNMTLIQADQVHALGFTGQGVTVAVLDSGLDEDHPDLRDNLVAEQCFCTAANGTGCCPNGNAEQSGPGSAEDDNGHGTNVTGIIISSGKVAPLGVAPGAGVMAVKVLDRANTFASSAQVISGLNWILMNRPDVKVVNMSLGTSALFSGACDEATAFTMAFAAAINTLKSTGVTVFASSGNNGSATQMSAPACVANTVAVGAVYDANVGAVSILGCTDPDTVADQVTCFTNSNPTLDLMAPGAPVTSTGLNGGVSTFFGTSQASPHAAGAAAVLLEVNPSLTPNQIETTLKTTGVGVTDAKNGLTFPRIDLLAAFHAVESELVIEVVIDVEPRINPRSRGKIPVAILTTDTFDATTVDPSTVHFGATGTEAEVVHSALEDGNADGRLDMILQFNTQETGIQCGETSASLTGKTTSGQAFQGTDAIVTVGCK